jgi:D-alanine---D-serine ligase
MISADGNYLYGDEFIMNQLKIAVIFGGCSPEHAVSLESAHSVISNIDREKYEPVLIGITETGEWLRFCGKPERIKGGAWNRSEDCVKAIISPDRAVHGLLEFAAEGIREVRLDAAMPVLHGKNGEDGTVQGLIQLAGIPLIGCGTLSSARRPPPLDWPLVFGGFYGNFAEFFQEFRELKR